MEPGEARSGFHICLAMLYKSAKGDWLGGQLKLAEKTHLEGSWEDQKEHPRLAQSGQSSWMTQRRRLSGSHWKGV